MKKKYEQLIPRRERELFEAALMMGQGYVLDFSDRTFDDFFYETIQIDPQTDSSYFDGRGTSKANRLRSFVTNAPAGVVAKLLRELWDYRGSLNISSDRKQTEIEANYFVIVSRFEGASENIDTSAFEAFEPSETLEELIAAIRRDLDAKRPHAGLDRLHTYCVKRFAALIRKHGGGECDEDDPLHSRVGKYAKITGSQHNLTPMSERIIKSTISVFDAMNGIRNNKSFAHDNPDLVDADEARFIFESIAAILRFIKAKDGKSFKD